MDLKNLPVNICPLCRQAALDQSTDQWTCDFCGCKLDFDPHSRHTRVTYWPAQYAALKAGVGSEWLSRRELFERVDAAAEAAPVTRAPKLVGPLLIIAAALLLLCVMLGAVASAIVISPSIARTRRTISQAYLPTATATITATATATQTALVTPSLEQPALNSPLDMTPSPSSEAPTAAPASVVATPTQLPTPALPTPAPQQVIQPQPTIQQLPPTFTPAPPPTLPAQPTMPPALPGAQTSPLPQPPVAPEQPGQPEQPTQPPAVPPTATPLPTPTVTTRPTVVITPQPLQPGSQLLAGTVRIVTVFANGSATQIEADEYVELHNEGQSPEYLDGWKLKAIRNADNVLLEEFVFPGGAVIAANQTCRIYTNLPYGEFNCGFSNGFASNEPIWPPNGARAVLVNAQGQEMARFVY